MSSARAPSTALLAAVLALACSAPLRVPFSGSKSPALTEEELRARVTEAANRFGISVATTADAIAQQSSDRNVRRRTLLWKIRMTPLVQRAALSRRPTEGLLDLLVLASAQRQYLTEGSGSALFGDQQELARNQARETEEHVQGVADALLDAQQLAALEKQVEELARKYPIRGEFMVEKAQNVLTEVNSSPSFDWVVRAPLAPFRALEGVESGAAAIHEFNGTAQQFNDLLASLPQQGRWQLELLLYDLEDHETVLAALASLQKVAESSERFSLAAEQLPVSVREQLAILLRDSQATQKELRTTIGALQGALDTAHPIAQVLERTAAHVEGAGTTWDQVVRDLAAVRQAHAQEEAGQRPFDVLDYERTAAQIGASAMQVRGVLAALPERTDARAWLDVLVWRALLLLVAGSALRVASRLLVFHITGRRTI